MVLAFRARSPVPEPLPDSSVKSAIHT
jgi:hypothetical protein